MNSKLRVIFKPAPLAKPETQIDGDFSPELRLQLGQKIEEHMLSRMLDVFPTVYYDD